MDEQTETQQPSDDQRHVVPEALVSRWYQVGQCDRSDNGEPDEIETAVQNRPPDAPHPAYFVHGPEVLNLAKLTQASGCQGTPEDGVTVHEQARPQRLPGTERTEQQVPAESLDQDDAKAEKACHQYATTGNRAQ